MGSTAANTAGAQPIPEAGESSRRGRPASHWHRAPSGHHRPHSCRHHSTSSLLRPGTFHAAGCTLLRRGTPGASGDRIPVPDGVDCPRPEGHAPGCTEMSPAVQPSSRRRRPPASAGAAPKGAGEEQGGEGPRLLVLGPDDDFVVNREAHRSSDEAVLGGAVVQHGCALRIVAGSDGHCGVKGD